MTKQPFDDALTVIIKPSNACNIRCRYCYNSKNDYSNSKMTLEQLRMVFERITDDYHNLRIIWHGGEPLLLGIDFFRKAVLIQHEIQKKKTVKFINSLQTNATLIDEDWCSFFMRNSIKVGVSFDGPPFGKSGRPNWSEAISGISMLRRNNIKFGTIAVINGGNIDYLNEIYDYFLKSRLNVNLNCVFLHGRMTNPLNRSYAIYPDEYVEKMNSLFNKWLFDSDCYSIVNPYYDTIRTIIDAPHSCEYTSCLYKFISIDYKGDVFPCGRFDDKMLCMGNIYSNSVHELFASDSYNKLVLAAIDRRNKCRSSCNIYNYCAGGCNFNAHLSGDIRNNSFPECVAYQKMLLHVKEALDSLDDNNSSIDAINRTVSQMIRKRKESRDSL